MFDNPTAPLSILITGGSGFLGKALVARLLEYDHSTVDRILVYSRDEAKHAHMRQIIADPEQRVRYLIGDVRDADRLTRACHGVDLVIHAAALKRIEVGIYNPDEMARTNIEGTQNVVNAVLATGSKAVLVSTDKACEPVSAYGYTKALAETIFWAGGEQFTVVRYGNVAGSTGSVIPIWRGCIERGAPIIMTDPECTRFWMTVGQAVELVLQAANAMPTSVLVPTLRAYRLGDLAKAMGAEQCSLIPLPTWEKLHESMQPGHPSCDAPRLTVGGLKKWLQYV